ncbi:MAG: FHA domain-containing protein [Bdellovibrionales bacterium]|nr:FHA domain-containing protein [Bdellovibrionales bacterium]
MAVVLLIKTPDGNVSDLPVLNKIVIGRSSSSDYKVNDGKLSGIHCSFELTPKGQLIFKDLGSTNGSFLNNSKIQEVHVKVNDIIKVGDTTISIDEKRLSSSDRTVLGVSKVKHSEGKTLPELTRAMKKADAEKTEKVKKEKEAGGDKKRPTIGLSQKMREEKERDKVARKDDKIAWAKNIVEVEESSGNTKALQLSEEILGKKKR